MLLAPQSGRNGRRTVMTVESPSSIMPLRRPRGAAAVGTGACEAKGGGCLAAVKDRATPLGRL